MFARTNTYTSDRNCKVVSELVPTARVSVPGPAKERGVCIGGEEHLVLPVLIGDYRSQRVLTVG